MFLLVTGGTGYVGSHAVAALTKAGHRVRILARSPGRVTDALAPLGVSGVATSVRGGAGRGGGWGVTGRMRGSPARRLGLLHGSAAGGRDALGERSRHRHGARHCAPPRTRPDRVRL